MIFRGDEEWLRRLLGAGKSTGVCPLCRVDIGEPHTEDCTWAVGLHSTGPVQHRPTPRPMPYTPPLVEPRPPREPAPLRYRVAAWLLVLAVVVAVFLVMRVEP